MERMLLAAMTVATTVVGVWWVPRGGARARSSGGWLRHPGTWLTAVIGAMLLNQLLFTAYVVQTWHGDVSRIARYLPTGWFDLADLGALAHWLPAWPFTVLYVQAALELPFAMLAYLLVCRWFGADAFRRAMRARWAVSASFTLTFCLVEWDLRNPHTVGDIVIRVACGILTPLLLPLLSEGTAGAPRLVAFALSAGALGCLVLAVYDTLTLYNLAHAVAWLLPVTAALIVLAVARWWAYRPVSHGPVMASATRSLGWFLVVFFVPALPLRYGFDFGTPLVSLLAGLVIVAAALRLGWDRHLIVPLLVCAGAGTLGAAIGYLLAYGYPEAKLLAAAAGFVLAAAAACTALDRWHVAGRPPAA